MDDDQHEKESVAQNREPYRGDMFRIYFSPTSPPGFSHFVRRFGHHSVVVSVAVVKFKVHLKGTTILSSKYIKIPIDFSFIVPFRTFLT